MNADIKEQIFEKMAGWQESAEEWRSPEGKKIPYRKFSRWIEPENNDFDSYTISVSVWPKNVSVEITESCGECGAETDSEDRWAMIQAFRVAKVPHSVFLERSEDLIKLAYGVLERDFTV